MAYRDGTYYLDAGRVGEHLPLIAEEDMTWYLAQMALDRELKEREERRK